MNSTCPICQNGESHEVLRASGQPILLNQMLATRAEALTAHRGELEFRSCDDCGFVWNEAFDPAAIEYGPGYVNDQSHSPRFREHLDEVRTTLLNACRGVDGAILEIGCGQGEFLRELCDRTGRNGIGFDPACVRASSDRLQLHRDVFDDRAAAQITQPISLVVCRHVLEHLQEPQLILDSLGPIVRANPKVAIYVEVPLFDWIAERATFFDMFYEHCSLFSEASMRRMLNGCGLGLRSITPTFDGQYLAVIAGTAGASVSPVRSTSRRNTEIARHLKYEHDRWANEIDELRSTHTTLLWGAGAKGVSVLNHLSLGGDAIPAVVDINPAKQGRYVPVTGQRIISPSELRRYAAGDRPLALIAMNPSYEPEIRQTLCDLGIDAVLTTLSEAEAVATRG